MDEQSSVRLIQALASIWSAIRERHPDVPGVVLLPAPAPRGRANVLGHFAPLRWRAREDGDHLFHEVVVVAEHLRSAADVTQTLLHEAAHALNFSQGISDCSASQYHNRRFKVAAEALGLEAHKVKHYGFADTRFPTETQRVYAAEIDQLESVLIHRRSLVQTKPAASGGTTPTTGKPAGSTRSRSRKAVCPCGFIIRTSRRTMMLTSILCSRCGLSYRFPDETADEFTGGGKRLRCLVSP